MSRPAKPWFRKGRGWYVKLNGQQIQLAGVDDPLKVAVGALAGIQIAPAQIQYRALTVPELCELFLRAIDGAVAPKSHNWYVGHLSGFATMHRALPVRNLKPHHLTDWLKSHPTWNGSTRRGAITAVKRAFSWATQQGYIAASPLAYFARPKMGVRSLAPAADIAAIIKAVRSAATLAFVTALAETGARPGELATATADGFNANAGTLTVTGKSGKRVLMLNAAALQLVAELAGRHPTGLLFRTPRGKPWESTTIYQTFRRLRDQTGVKGVTAYSFRHAYATQAIARNVNPILLAGLMGHKDLKMIQQVYCHPDAEALRAAAEQATQKRPY
jgi:integrase